MSAARSSSLTSPVFVNTMFAPNDQAFQMLSDEIKTKLANNTIYLKQVVDYHIVFGKQLTTSMNKHSAFRTNAKENGTHLQVLVNNFMVRSMLLFLE